MLEKRPYAKPPTTYAQQIDKSRSRGMLIDDQNQAAHFLQHTNYYRLSGYWLAFEAEHETHRFKEGTTFDQVVKLYRFDRTLRLLILDAIEQIEVSVRAQIAYRFAHDFGPHGYSSSEHTKDSEKLARNIESLKEEINRSQETFINHLATNYEEELPPIWAACEVMSLGLLSRWFSNLSVIRSRQEIAKVYDLDQNLLASWLHHLTLTRNLCAHHSRLWNRNFIIRPKAPKSDLSPLKGAFVANKGIYNTLVILIHLTSIVSGNQNWKTELRTLLANNPDWLESMQFPLNWSRLEIWQ